MFKTTGQLFIENDDLKMEFLEIIIHDIDHSDNVIDFEFSRGTAKYTLGEMSDKVVELWKQRPKTF